MLEKLRGIVVGGTREAPVVGGTREALGMGGTREASVVGGTREALGMGGTREASVLRRPEALVNYERNVKQNDQFLSNLYKDTRAKTLSAPEIETIIRDQIENNKFSKEGVKSVIEGTKAIRKEKWYNYFLLLKRPFEMRKQAQEVATQYMDPYLTGAHLKEIATLNINKANHAVTSIETQIKKTDESIDEARMKLESIYTQLGSPLRHNPDTDSLDKEIWKLTQGKQILEKNLTLTENLSQAIDSHLEKIYVDMENAEKYQHAILQSFHHIATWSARKIITGNNLDKRTKDIKGGQNFFKDGPQILFGHDMYTNYSEAKVPPFKEFADFDPNLGHSHSTKYNLEPSETEARKGELDKSLEENKPSKQIGDLTTKIAENWKAVDQDFYFGHLSEEAKNHVNEWVPVLRARGSSKDHAAIQYLDIMTRRTPLEMQSELDIQKSLGKLTAYEADYLREAHNTRDIRLITDAGDVLALEILKKQQSNEAYDHYFENIRTYEKKCMDEHKNIYDMLKNLETKPSTVIKEDNVQSHLSKLEKASLALQREKAALHNASIKDAKDAEQSIREFIDDQFYKDTMDRKFTSLEDAIKSAENLGQGIATVGVASLVGAVASVGISNPANAAVSHVVQAAQALH